MMARKYKVTLTYFKEETGKYYTDGAYFSKQQELFDIWDEVDTKRILGRLPGLSHGSKDFIILVSVPGHIDDHPKLIFKGQ